MIVCPACQNQIPTDSRFCGFCGFRLSPITLEAHRSLSQELASLAEEPEVVPLTRRKDKSGEARPAGAGPQLVVMAEDVALDDTVPGGAQQPGPGPALEDTSPAGQRVQRRSDRRYPLKVEVNYSSEHNFYTGFMENMSSGGLFVATHEPLALGDALELTFTVPGLQRACTAECEVRWVREFEPDAVDAAPGMGLRFVSLDPEARAAIELFIKHREPIFYDDDF